MEVQSDERRRCNPCRHHEHGGAEAVGRGDPQRLARQAIGAGVAHTLQAVISTYAVASAGFKLLGGRAADLLGPRRTLGSPLIRRLCSSRLG
jgi:hypothetical protein